MVFKIYFSLVYEEVFMLWGYVFFCYVLIYYSLLLKYIGETLINNIMYISNVQLYNITSEYPIVCLPPETLFCMYLILAINVLFNIILDNHHTHSM